VSATTSIRSLLAAAAGELPGGDAVRVSKPIAASLRRSSW
jgi:hypothetical protein